MANFCALRPNGVLLGKSFFFPLFFLASFFIFTAVSGLSKKRRDYLTYIWSVLPLLDGSRDWFKGGTYQRFLWSIVVWFIGFLKKSKSWKKCIGSVPRHIFYFFQKKKMPGHHEPLFFFVCFFLKKMCAGCEKCWCLDVPTKVSVFLCKKKMTKNWKKACETPKPVCAGEMPKMHKFCSFFAHFRERVLRREIWKNKFRKKGHFSLVRPIFSSASRTIVPKKKSRFQLQAGTSK